MQYIARYSSPIGTVNITADETALTALWFNGQNNFSDFRTDDFIKKDIPVLKDAKRWLDIYFSGHEPDFSVPVHLSGTDFQKRIWKIISAIGYGETVTYGEIARIAAQQAGMEKISARAVGGAAARNKILIIIPCHRIVGAGGAITGYSAGTDKKSALLNIEKKSEKRIFIP